MEQVGSIVMYLIIALAIIVFSVMAVTERRILRAATYLLFTLFAAAGIYFMLDYQFLGAVQIAVYAGGIMVLFVFAILLTHKPGEKTALLSSKKKALGAIAALLCAVVSGVAVFTQLSFATARLGENPGVDMSAIGETLMGTARSQYLLPFEAVSVLLLACIIGGIVLARKK